MALIAQEFVIDESNSNESDNDSVEFAKTKEDRKYKKGEIRIVLVRILFSDTDEWSLHERIFG